MLIGTAFLSGFTALHPQYIPFSYTFLMLVHVLSAEVMFVLIPYTKIVHCVLFPFTRVASVIFWKFPSGAGDKIAKALRGEKAGI